MRRSLILALSLFCGSAWGMAKAASYTLVAPPRQGRVQAVATYGKIARFLTRTTGVPFVFRYTDNWLTYMADVRDNTADVYFDGPAFIGWRVAHWHDTAAVALAGQLHFVLVTKKGGRPLTKTSDLIGRSVCAFSPPNLGTLTLDSWFANPERQPYLVVIHSFAAAGHDVIDGNCTAALEPLPVFKRQAAHFAGKLKAARELPGLPNQAFSINAKVPSALRHKIIEALLSPAGRAATKPLRDMFGHRSLVRVHSKTYTPYRKLLHVMVGF